MWLACSIDIIYKENLPAPAVPAVFIRLNAAAFIKFFVIRVRRLFEGGVYLKSNLFLPNNTMVTDHFNLIKKRTCFSACLKSHFYIVLNFTICM